MPDTRSDIRQKVLFDAIQQGNIGAVKTLLGQGVGINSPNPAYESTPLQFAVTYKRVGIVKLLLERGAKVEVSTSMSPLSLAASEGSVPIIKLLLAHGARVDARSPHDRSTPLIDAATSSLSLVPDKQKTIVVETLLAAGADPNAREGARGMTALMWAARHRQATMATDLLAHGANPNAKDTGGMTVLMHAAVGGSRPVVKALLLHQADRNAKEPGSGWTALDFARAHRHLDLVPLLKSPRAGRRVPPMVRGSGAKRGSSPAARGGRGA